ncbi:MAG TPA: WD40 repeat domain-containing protein [Pyrinomonadaceae bacterium]|nr:WD40 repeat domain-containing protein [Pyrinomonadaceae bacterium]
MLQTARFRKRATLLGHTGRVEALVFSPDGQVLATGSKDRTVKLWDAATGQLRTTLTGRKGWIADAPVVFSPNGRQLATFGGRDKTVKLWAVATGELSFDLVGHKKSVSAVAFSPDGRTLATGGEQEQVRLWDTATGQLKTTLSHKNISQLFIVIPSFSSDGKSLLVSGLGKNIFTVWDPETGTLRAVLSGHGGMVLNAVFSPDGRLIATSGHDYPVTESLESSVKVWDARTGVLERELTGHKDTIIDLAFSSDGTMLGTASRDQTVKLWDVSKGELLKTLKGSDGRFFRLAFSPDAQMLATVDGSDRHAAKLWSVETGNMKVSIPVTGYKTELLLGHQYAIEEVIFSPDGKLLMAWSRNMVTLLDTADGTFIVTLENARAPAIFSPDGRTLATAAQDNTAALWDVPGK